MFRTLLLIIIYISFISLGLPDSLLGASWTLMHLDFGVPVSYAGIITMTVSVGTIVSSFFGNALINRFQTGPVTFVSVLMTAGALTGYYMAPSFLWFLLFSIPMGIGAGAVDMGLNNYVALKYEAHHMSWLHCFWGIGATISPLIMAHSMSIDNNWRGGYLIVGVIQICLAVVLVLTLFLWKKNGDVKAEKEVAKKTTVSHLKGIKPALAAFLLYCGLESTAGLWGGTFLVVTKNIEPAIAAKWVSAYYGGIMAGRFISGFIIMKVSSRIMIAAGQFIIIAGVLMIFLPLPSGINMFGLVMVGLGCAPIYPCMLHMTPERFGAENSQRIMGLQMGVAYCGATFLPPLFGFIASYTTIALLPVFLMIYAVVMFLASEKVNLALK